MPFLKIINIALLTLSLKVYGQDSNRSNIRIMDVGMHIDAMPIAGNKVETNLFYLTAKIDSIEITKKIYFLLGSNKDKDDLLKICGVVKKEENDHYSIIYEGKKYLFQNYTIAIPVTISSDELKNLTTVTFYAENNLAIFTNRLYFKFK